MPILSEAQLVEMEKYLRLWGRLNQTDALALLAAYRATLATPSHLEKPVNL